jgi:hypothetical protein
MSQLPAGVMQEDLSLFTTFDDVQPALEFILNQSSVNPSSRFIIGVESVFVNLENEEHVLHTLTMHENFGKDYQLVDDSLDCTLYLSCTEDLVLENVALSQASFATQFNIPLQCIWVIIMKTSKGEKIIFRG